MKHSRYCTAVLGLKALAEIGEIDFVNDMKSKLKSNSQYVPDKDSHLMKWMTPAEKKEFLSLSL